LVVIQFTQQYERNNMSTYTGKYSDDRASDATFKRDKSFLDDVTRGGEGASSARPKYPDFAGGMSDRRKPVDPDLSSSGGSGK
jgi:hypothetical protein